MITKNQVVALATLVVMVSSGFSAVMLITIPQDSSTSTSGNPEIDIDNLLAEMNNQDASSIQQTLSDAGKDSQLQAFNKLMQQEMDKPGVEGTPQLSEDLELEKLLSNNDAEYRKTWEPWITKAAIRTMVSSPDNEFLLLGGGYLYDNTIKIYRYNSVLDEYVHVWDSGDQIIQGDVVSLAFGDTDYNKFPEIVAGSADGHVYVFEQTHIYDPKTNFENRFDLVWKSPLLQQVWGVAIADTDLDYRPDIVTGSFDGTVRFYEYVDHSGYPFNKEHWIEYEEKYKLVLPNKERVTAIYAGQGLDYLDTNGNELPEVVIGTWSGATFIIENNGTVIEKLDGGKLPLTQDDSYRLLYENDNQFWRPITRIKPGNLDADRQKELGFLVPGQGVYTFDFDEDTQQYFFFKLIKDPASWELGSSPPEYDPFLNNPFNLGVDYPVNTYVDWSVPVPNVTQNVWSYNNYTGQDEMEPSWWDNKVTPMYPSNTSMGFFVDKNYSEFRVNATHNATAILDFGYEQTATGDGRQTDGSSYAGYDLQVIGQNTGKIKFWNVSLSNSVEGPWAQVQRDQMTQGSCTADGCYLLIDTDPALNTLQMIEYRYVKLTYLDQFSIPKIDAVNTTTLGRPLSEATSFAFGSLDTEYTLNLFSYLRQDASEDKLIVGTVDGKLYAYEFNPESQKMQIVWDSYTFDLFNLKTNIWDIIPVSNKGKLPTWLATQNGNTTLDVGTSVMGGYNSHTHAHLLAFEVLSPYYARTNDDLITVDQNGETFLFPQSKDAFSSYWTNKIFPNVNAYYTGKGLKVSHSFADTNGDGFTELMVTGTWDGTVVDLSKDQFSQGGLDLWLSAAPGTPFVGPIKLDKVDVTGLLGNALARSSSKISVTFSDLDEDGDLDIVFTNGRVYVLWNILSYLTWKFDSTYFNDINSNTRNRMYFAPIAVDLDEDADTDLIFSYSQTGGDRTRYGATYWQNLGSEQDPIWKENKWLFNNPVPETNLAFATNNYTNIQLILDENNRVINMTAYTPIKDQIVGFYADYVNHDNFMLATYPLLQRVEVNLRDSDNLKNFGYRIFKTWDTAHELDEWTQSITFSDMDKDGKGELVVGDYDNNAYVFEYLTSGLNGSVNTYKRAYRSPDLVQNIELDESPYASDQLAGLSGSFNRTIWEHANFVVAGTDVDQNGLQEFIVTAGLSVFVFELRDDRPDLYRLMWSTDLHFGKYAKLFDEYSQITAVGGGWDLDYNHRGEFILAVDNLIIMFEYDGDDTFREVYSGVPTSVGRYAQLGNPFYADYTNNVPYQILTITDFEVGNLDKDGYQEIFVGGYFTQPFGRLDGYVGVLEHRLGTIVTEYELNSRLLREAPVNDLLIDDQDYDGNLELFVAHGKGVDVYEYNRTAPSYELVKLTHITSSMNHPVLPVRPVSIVGYGTLDNDLYELRDHDMIELTKSVGTLLPGDLVEVAVVNGYMGVIYSRDNGVTWNPVPVAQVANKDVYQLKYVETQPLGSIIETAYDEYHPSLVQLVDGTILIAFGAISPPYNTGSGTVTAQGIFVIEYDQAGNFNPADAVRGNVYLNQLTRVYEHPSVFENPTQPGKASITYIKNVNSSIEMKHRTAPHEWDFNSGLTTDGYFFPQFGFASDNKTFLASSQDVVYYPEEDGFLIAFSGFRHNETKADRDIFVGFANNNSMLLNRTSKVSDNPAEDLFPSISLLHDKYDSTVIVSYEEQGNDPGGRVMTSHSETGGRSFNPPDAMNKQLENMVTYCLPQLGCFSFILIPKSKDVKQTQLALKSSDILQKVAKIDSKVDASVYDQYSPYGDGDFVLDFASEATLLKTSKQVSENQETASQQQSSQYSIDLNQFNILWIASIEAFSPKITGRIDGGFGFTYSTNIAIGDLNSFLAYVLSALYQLAKASVATKQSGDVKASTNDRLIDRVQPNLLKLQLLMYGFNPNSLFVKSDVGSVLNIDTGDSDGDLREEVVMASDRGAFLSELESNNKTHRVYTEIWSKEDYPHRLHDVALGDANGNGFDEIYVAGQQGNVYAYELIALDTTPLADLDFMQQIWTRPSTFEPPVVPDTSSYAFDDLMQVHDFNNDGEEEILYTTNSVGNNQSVYLRSKTGVLLWESVIPNTSLVTALGIKDMGMSEKPRVIVGQSNGDVFVLEGDGGTIIRYMSNSGAGPVTGVVTDTINGSVSFAVSFTNIVKIFNDTTLMGTYNVPSSDGTVVELKVLNINLSDNATKELTIMTTTGRVSVLNPDGTLLNNLDETYDSTSTLGGSVDAEDITKNGRDELIFAANRSIFVFSYNGTSFEQMYNLSGLSDDKNLSSFSTSMDELQVSYNQDSEQFVGTVVSNPTILDFEDGVNNAFVLSDYEDQGVIFDYPWYYVDFTSNTYFGHTSGVKGLYYQTSGPAENASFSFTSPQQYVRFDIGNPNYIGDFNYRVRALDRYNNTVYLSDVLKNTAFKEMQEVEIALGEPVISKIVIEGKAVFQGKFNIDTLVFGGSNLVGFNALTGEPLWSYKGIPSKHISVASSIDFNASMRDLLLVSFDVHDIWVSKLGQFGGSYALDLSTGKLAFSLNGLSSYGSFALTDLGSGQFAMLTGDSKIIAYSYINKTKVGTINYEHQDSPVWLVETMRPFKGIKEANLDTDSQKEYIVYDKRQLVAALDSNGTVLWKYVEKSNVREIIVGNLDTSTVTSEIILLTEDGRAVSLSPTTGLALNDTLLTTLIPNTARVMDLTGDGTPEVVIGYTFVYAPAYGVVASYSYNPSTFSLTQDKIQLTKGGVVEILPVELGDDKNVDEIAILGYKGSVMVYDNDLTPFWSDLTSAPIRLAVSDYDEDWFSEVSYITSNGKLVVKELDGNPPTTLHSLVIDTAPFNHIRSLTTFDNSTGNTWVAYSVTGRGTKMFSIDDGLTSELVWKDPSIYSGIMGLFDADLDGNNELLLRNDNLVYALDTNISLQPIWSISVSDYRIIEALVTDYNSDGRNEVLLLNKKGELIMAQSIPDPKSPVTLDITGNKLSYYKYNNIIWDKLPDIRTINNIVEDQLSGNNSAFDYNIFMLVGFLSGIIVSVISVKRSWNKKQIPRSDEASSINMEVSK